MEELELRLALQLGFGLGLGNAVNSGHFVPSATTKGSARTPLGPKICLTFGRKGFLMGADLLGMQTWKTTVSCSQEGNSLPY